MAECEKVLAYPRLQIDPHDTRRVMAAIRNNVRLVKPKIILRESSDEDDNRFPGVCPGQQGSLFGHGQHPTFSAGVEVHQNRPAQGVFDSVAGPKAA